MRDDGQFLMRRRTRKDDFVFCKDFIPLFLRQICDLIAGDDLACVFAIGNRGGFDF